MGDKNSVTLPNIRLYLSGIPLPANRKDIVEYARNKGASDGIIDALEKLPDQEFSNSSQIISKLEIKE